MRTVAQGAIRWRKSSSSNADGACVEVAHTFEAVRDSKNPAGPMLAFADGRPLRRFVVGVSSW